MTTDIKPTNSSDPTDNSQNGTDVSPASNGASEKKQPPAHKDSSMMYRGVTYTQKAKRFAPKNLVLTEEDRPSPLLQWFYDLPVRNKQLISLVGSKVFSVIGLVGISSLLIIVGGRRQLVQQSKSELAVA
ncbi:MAG: hypothetical protein AAGF01_33075, partial [Cyanobacteria bacterium P01_G01_bin.38]